MSESDSSNTILLKDCSFVVTQNPNRDVLKDVSILIEGGKITKIFRTSTPTQNVERVVDCRGKIVMPALINAHTHAAMTLLRGYNDDAELHSWLQSVWKVEAKLTGKDVEIGTLLACLEMLKTGTCCFVDMYFFMDCAARAVEKSGMKALLGHGMLDFGDESKREEELKETKRFIKFVEELGNPRIRAVVAPHAIYTCSPELLVEAKKVSEKRGLLYTIHLSETRKEVHDCYRERGKYPVEYLDELGVIDDRFVGFHAAWMTRKEISLLASRKATVVNCPASNMKLATGGAFPFREYTDAGVNCCLGTDGACSNNSLNMLEEIKFAALLQKWFRWNAQEMVAQQALDMATINAAEAFKLNNGSVEVGKVADVVVLDASSCFLLPHHSIVSNIVYASSHLAVEHVIIDGVVVIENGRHAWLDEEKIKDDFLKTAERLVSEVKEEGEE